jgi:nitrogen regulatory protein P-II 2
MDGDHARIVAIFKPFRLDAVLLALTGLPVSGISHEEVRGYGRQKGHLELYQGTEYSITFLPKVRLECVCPLPELSRVTEAIRAAARTGRIGDGKIFVVEASAP